MIRIVISKTNSTLFLILIVTSGVGWAEDKALLAMDTNLPAPVGYNIGDILQVEIDIRVVNSDWKIDKDSFPVRKRLNRWLELQTVEVKRYLTWRSPSYRISVQYQIIGNPEKLTALIVPPFYFNLVSKEENWPVVVESWSYSLSPILLHEDRLVGAAANIQPALKPLIVPLFNRVLRILLFGTFSICIIIFFIYRMCAIRYIAARNLPFAIASKNISALCNLDKSGCTYRDALRFFHQAVEKSYGNPVFLDDLDDFIDRCPHFRSQLNRIRNVYLASNAEFFDLERKCHTKIGLKNELLPLCKTCHQLELSV